MKNNRKTITCWITLALLCANLSACVSTPKPKPVPVIQIDPTRNAKLLSEQSTRVAAFLDSLRNGKDIAFSEPGVIKILNAVARRADGDSRAQILAFIKDQLPLINDSVYKNANIMYFKDIESIYKGYIRTLSNFVIASSVRAINKKVAKITDGLIPWTLFFDKSQPKNADFTALCNNQPQVGKVATMHTKADRIIKDGDMRAISLFLEEGYELIIAMSDDKTASPARASQWLYADGGKHLSEIVDESGFQTVIVSLPKLDISSSHSLIPALSKQGVRDIFSKEKANFSNLSNKRLHVNLFEQKVRFQADEKDEKGNKIALSVSGILNAPTGGPMYEKPKPIVFDVDHPFAYAIVKNRGYQQIIVAGEVNSLGICR